MAHKRLSEQYHRQRSSSIESLKRSKDGDNAGIQQQQTERTPLLPSSKKPKSRSSRKRHDLAVYAIEPTSEDGSAADSLGDHERAESGAIAIRELPRPAEIVRDLAENGTELAISEGTDGRIQRKWLQVRQRPQSKQSPTMNGDSPLVNPFDQSDRAASRSRGKHDKASHKPTGKASQSGTNFYRSKVSLEYLQHHICVLMNCCLQLWWLGLCLMAPGELGNFTSSALEFWIQRKARCLRWFLTQIRFRSCISGGTSRYDCSDRELLHRTTHAARALPQKGHCWYSFLNSWSRDHCP